MQKFLNFFESITQIDRPTLVVDKNHGMNIFFRYFTRKILRFFGVDSSFEEQSKQIWGERRKRLAIKKLGGVKVLFSVFIYVGWLKYTNYS